MRYKLYDLKITVHAKTELRITKSEKKKTFLCGISSVNMHTINNKKENNHIKTKPKKPINLTGWESGDRRKEGRNGSEGS
jgi:hypothetical protein